MKRFMPLFSLVLTIYSAKAQHSPFFYQAESGDNGITNTIHSRFVKHMRFIAAETIGTNEIELKENEKNNEIAKLEPAPIILSDIYLEHSVKYYYDKYLADPSMKKEDWDYSELYKGEDNTRTVHSNLSSTVVGWLVFVLKVDGKEINSFILLMAKEDMTRTTKFSDVLWYSDMSKKWDAESDDYRLPTPDEKFKILKDKENSFVPFMYYMRDFGTPGKHKIEYDVYPGKINCEDVNNRSNEVICHGEFEFTINAETIAEMKKAGGVKLQPNVRVYTMMGSSFTRL